MGPTKPGHDESTSLMTISSPPVPGGDPSTGVRKRQTSDHRTRPPPRPRRNGGIADPEGFAVSPCRECQCLTTRRTGRGYAKSRKVVPSQHEEDQTVFLPFPFVRHPSQPDSLEPTRRN